MAARREIICRDETLILDHRRCVFWPSQKILLLADVHLGKEAVFQRRGMAIPDGIAEKNLSLIEQLLREYRPSQLLVLGDLVHALPSARENWIDHLGNLLADFASTNFTVVSGNHDKPGTANRLPDSICWTSALELPPFRFRHEPAQTPSDSDKLYTVCGHLHPCFTLRLRKGPSIRMPVFWVGSQQMVLPAFGEFTGMHVIRPARHDQYFGVGPDGIVELSPRQSTSA